MTREIESAIKKSKLTKKALSEQIGVKPQNFNAVVLDNPRIKILSKVLDICNYELIIKQK